MGSIYFKIGLIVLLSLACMGAWSQVEPNGFSPELEVDFDPVWDSLLSAGAMPKNWKKDFLPSADLRKDYRFYAPLGQGTAPYCAVWALAHAESCERLIFNAGAERLLPQPLLSSVKTKGKNPQLLGDVILVALEEKMISTQAWSAVFSRFEEKESKIIKLKRAISNRHPVLVRLSKSPEKPNHNKQYRPESYADKAHAMVVTGYDDRFVFLMNSRGQHWGDSGYCNVPKDTFFQLVIDGIMLNIEARDMAAGWSNPPVPIAGETILYRKSGDVWPAVNMAFDTSSRACLPVRASDWDFHRDRFQLGITLPELACIYLLNFTPDTVALLEKFIYEPAGYHLMPPFRLDTPAEFLVLLHASVPLLDMEAAMKSLNVAHGSVYERIEDVFGTALVPPAAIQRQEDAPATFKAEDTEGSKGYIVPTILGFQSFEDRK